MKTYSDNKPEVFKPISDGGFIYNYNIKEIEVDRHDIIDNENETNIKVIQEVMGHADVSTTMNIYAEANPEVTRASIEKLAKNMDIL